MIRKQACYKKECHSYTIHTNLNELHFRTYFEVIKKEQFPILFSPLFRCKIIQEDHDNNPSMCSIFPEPKKKIVFFPPKFFDSINVFLFLMKNRSYLYIMDLKKVKIKI